MKNYSEGMLSVILLVYNQEKYIAQALESILSQKTNFNFVVRVFDDCSKDDTAKIAKKYADLDDRVKIFVNEKNLGPKGNVIKALASVDTKYFAILEGDDYWCDNDKIQIQIDLLEADKGLIICGHNTHLMKNEKITNDKILPENFAREKNRFNILDVIEGRFYAHPSSIIYRTLSPELMSSLIAKKDSYARLGDFFNLMFFAQNGDLIYIDKSMSVYRTDSGGIWSRVDDVKKQEDNIYMTLVYRELLNKKYSPNFDIGAFYTVRSFIEFLKEKKCSYLKIKKYQLLVRHLRNSNMKKSFIGNYLSNFSKKTCLFAYRAMSRLGL